MMERRRTTDEAKLTTQRVITYIIILIFAVAGAVIMINDDQAERSQWLQMIYNMTMLAVGFWLGSSKGAADRSEALTRIASAGPAATAAAVAAEANRNSGPMKVEEVKVEAENVSVTEVPTKGEEK